MAKRATETEKHKPAPKGIEVEIAQLSEFVEQSYLNYSMYVVLDRALPHIADGLKPVQRRIIYAMSELSLGHDNKHKKSARTVGDVIGKYHPHGDSACYEAMVTMAQAFSYRYCLVDGQGNWGSPDDPKSFAAMRYTESKLTRYANSLLSELYQGTADFSPNFDGTLKEPRLMPARLPNIIINGSMGIAVGMATDIPAHNLNEVVAACQLLLRKPKATNSEIMAVVKGPDFATGCQIVSSRSEINECYKTGNGVIRTRARWLQEDGNIVITHLPHQVSSSKVQEVIAAQMREKKLPMVEDLRDESDYENPTRIVIVPKSNRVDLDGLMAHLFATTDLEKSIKVNLNMIGLDGKPQVKTLHEIITEWLGYRSSTVRRRLEYRLKQVMDRMHILDALMVTYLNIDEVIRIIRRSEDPKAELMKKFKLTEIQANAVLDLRLRNLMKLEEMEIKQELSVLAKEKVHIETILADGEKLKKIVSDELEADAALYGDKRRSPFSEQPAATAMAIEEVIPTEPITVILSKAGWIRGAKGHDFNTEGLAYKAGDEPLAIKQGKSNQPLIILDSHGRVYTLNPRDLPSARGQGEPVTTKIDLQNGAMVVDAIIDENDGKYLVGNRKGYGFIVKFEELVSRNRAGKVLLTSEPPMFGAIKVMDPEKTHCCLATTGGKLLAFPLKELPELAKGKGNKLISLKDGEAIAAVALLKQGESLVVSAGGKELIIGSKEMANYQGARATRGATLPKAYRMPEKLHVKPAA